MKIQTKQSDKDRRLAELARKFKARQLTLEEYQEQGYRLILSTIKKD